MSVEVEIPVSGDALVAALTFSVPLKIAGQILHKVRKWRAMGCWISSNPVAAVQSQSKAFAGIRRACRQTRSNHRQSRITVLKTSSG